VSFLDSNGQGTSISIIKSPGVKIRDKKSFYWSKKEEEKKNIITYGFT
jgi:hypothetical protein